MTVQWDTKSIVTSLNYARELDFTSISIVLMLNFGHDESWGSLRGTLSQVETLWPGLIPFIEVNYYQVAPLICYNYTK